MTYGFSKSTGISSPEHYSDCTETPISLGETLGHSLVERIGNTPLLRLDQVTRDLPGVVLLGKAEWYNPGGSVKDRAAANIVAEGRRKGLLRPGKILLDATSGNTGIAYAMLGSAEGFPVTLCMPENVSRERKQILQGYGQTFSSPSIPTPPPRRHQPPPSLGRPNWRQTTPKIYPPQPNPPTNIIGNTTPPTHTTKSPPNLGAAPLILPHAAAHQPANRSTC